MSLEDHFSLKGVQSHSSGIQRTPVENGFIDYTLRGSEVPKKILKSGPKRELLNTSIYKEKKIKTSLKSRMSEQLKACSKNRKNAENKKGASSSSAPRKQSRKVENPVCFTQAVEQPRCMYPQSWKCKNKSCQNAVSIDETFCGRCSCCICHQFDDNKDPSLWLVCESDGRPGDSCGSSCHVECAFAQEKLGVVKLGQYMQLDGSYCCASCGKVSGILGCWQKQLAIAKDARRIGPLCYRLFLSYRLLDNTSRFKELHEIVTEAKTMLEAEVGPINDESVMMSRAVVTRLAIAADLEKLFSTAIDKAEEWLAIAPSSTPIGTVVSLPSACRFHFEEVTSSSLVIVLIDLPMPVTDSIKGYKLWYCKTREDTFPNDPSSIFPREKRRISVMNLQPCTEYSFRVISYTDDGDLGHSEAKCFTKSVEIFNKNLSSASCKKERGSSNGKEIISDLAVTTDFMVKGLGKVVHLAWSQEQGNLANLEGMCSADIEQGCAVMEKGEALKAGQSTPPISRDLDLNVASVPDLNEDFTLPLESSRDEDNGHGPYDDAASHGLKKNGLGLVRSNGSGPSDDSLVWAPTRTIEHPAVDSSLLEAGRKRGSSAIEGTPDSDSTLINGSPFCPLGGPGSLDSTFEYCVKVIRRLETHGHITADFRCKLLTWFSLRATNQEHRVVNTFIQTLIEDPRSLAEQLVDSFTDIVSSKKPKNSFTSLPS